MCYSKNLSLASLACGIIASTSLILFGNKQSASTNKMIGYYFAFVALMQLIEYFLWIDIDCVNGFNKMASILGPILNHLQPIVLVLLSYTYLQPAKVIPVNVVIFANVLYLIYAGHHYYKHVSDSSNFCVKTNADGHLDWTWKSNFIYTFFTIINIINIANFYENTNVMVAFVVSYLILVIDMFNFKNNYGELWCFMVTCIPFINLFMEKVLNINN